MSKKKNLLVGLGIALVLLISYFALSGSKTEEKEAVKVKVKKGKFESLVVVTGELQAKNSEDIMGPSGLRSIGIWNVNITDLIPEGTVVKEGDYVATLDRSEISTRLKDLENELQKIQSQYLQTKLDTALELREKRDELINLKYQMEEQKLVMKQSKYEPPAIIRQAEIAYEKAERTYEQSKQNYQLKRKQAAAKMQEISATLSIQRNKYEQTLEVMKQFVINAPKPGMVVYLKLWNGKKKTVGSTISPWNPAVATLPDLSEMVTVTYVNEVDISKIKADQNVQIGIDAFPEKQFTGKVIEVANVGEQRPNSEAKVFEVKILLNESDTTLRPGMSTGNTIITGVYEDVLYAPLEAIHGNDSVSYVFLDDGLDIIRQEVITGTKNENEVIIEKGVEEDDLLYLSVPGNAEELELKGLQEKVES